MITIERQIAQTETPKLLNTLNVSPGDLRPSDLSTMRENITLENFHRTDHPIMKYVTDDKILAQGAASFDWESIQLRGAYLDQFEPLEV